MLSDRTTVNYLYEAVLTSSQAVMPNMDEFSELDGYDEVSWISWEIPGQVVVSFHRMDLPSGGIDNLYRIDNLYMYLLGASISDLNICCNPHLPLFRGVQRQIIPDNPEGFRDLLTFSFEQGYFSIFCGEVFFHKVSFFAQVRSGD